MPSYAYKCPSCGAKSTIIQSIFDNTAQYCEVDLTELVRVFEAPPIHFKGGGWGGQ